MPNVIVVDDDPTNMTLLKLLLELDGFVVNTYSDVPSAKAAAQKDTDAFVIDYHLARGMKPWWPGPSSPGVPADHSDSDRL